MTVHLQLLTGRIDAAPGEVVQGWIQASNDGGIDQLVEIRLVGLSTGPGASPPPLAMLVPAGETVEFNVPIWVPDTLGIGEHAIAFEALVQGAEGAPSLNPLTLSIASVRRIEMVAQPTTIRGRRKARFVLELTNNEAEPVAFMLDASAPDVAVRFDDDGFQLVPGQRASTRAKVKGPRNLFGEPTQHNLVITARGKASSTSITAPYLQRPLIATRMRTAVALLTVIALWAAGMVAVLRWAPWEQNPGDLAGEVTEDAPGASDGGSTGGGQSDDGGGGGSDDGTGSGGSDDGTGSGGNDDGTGSGGNDDGTGSGGSDDGTGSGGNDDGTGSGGNDDGTGSGGNDDGTGSGGNDDGTGSGGNDDGTGSGGNDDGTGRGEERSTDPGSDGDPAPEPAEAAARTPESTTITGSITIDADDAAVRSEALAAVKVKLRELELGEAPSAESEAVGFASGRNAVKLWPARYAAPAGPLGLVRQTESIVVAEPDPQGIWLFSDVRLRRTYELAIQKEGFQTQSFVIEPPDDGTLVEIDVSLKPAEGSMSGTVTGPPAGRRNAEITVTDGTLTFSATATNDEGGFEIAGLNTPGVYTVIAQLPGFGTAVQQVTLGAGERDVPVEMPMSAGLASVSGTVFGADRSGQNVRLGGVTIAVTVGEVTQQTTTLTEGSVGFYNIPGLAFDPDNPQNATISAELDGYLSEAVRVPLDRADIAGVNFLMRRSSVAVSGVVRSGAGGPGIGSASVVLKTNSFTSKSQTIPNGSFDVTELPPGSYVVEVRHFQHESFFESVELAAGAAPARLDIALTPKNPADLAAQPKATLTIRVIDPEAATQAEREVKGSTAVVTNLATGEKQPLPEESETNEITYTEVPFGTYSVVVSNSEYNTAAARTVTVGSGGAEIEVALDKKLNARGQIVDSVSLDPLVAADNVEVTVDRTNADGTTNKIEGVTVSYDETTGENSWETPNLELGLYEVTAQASGYRILPQVIDTSLRVAPREDRFEIRPEMVLDLEVNKIRADPYAKVTGRVFSPTIDASGSVRFAPIDAAPDASGDTLGVEMTCDGSEKKSAEITDGLPTPDPSGLGKDTFTFARNAFENEQLAAADKGGATCTIAATAVGFTDPDAITLRNVTVSNGASLTDRIVNIALAKPPVDAFNGTLYWIDPRFPNAKQPLDGVSIEAIGTGAVTGFLPSISGPLQNELEPRLVLEQIRTTTGTDGTFVLNDQIVGQAIYEIDDPRGRFDGARMSVLIDEDGVRTITPIQGIELQPTRDANGLQFRIEPVARGTVRGTPTILSSDRTRQPSELVVLGQLPNETDQTGTVNGNNEFTFENVQPGTWEVVYDRPPNHRFLSADGQTILGANVQTRTVSGQVTPNDVQVFRFDTTLVELGRIEVVLEPTTPFQSPPTVSVTEVGTSTPTPAELGPYDLTDPKNLPNPAIPPNYLVTEIPVKIDVGAADPFPPTDYVLSLTAANFDVEGATVWTCACKIPTKKLPDLGADAIAVDDVRAGTKTQLRIEIPTYGSVQRQIQGTRADGSTVTLDLESVGGGGEATAEVKVYNLANGALTAVDLEPTPGTAPGSFLLSGPPGYYDIEITHPEYTAASRPMDPQVPGSPPGVVLLANDQQRVSVDAWQLTERTTAMFIDARTSLGGARADVSYTLTPLDPPRQAGQVYPTLSGTVPTDGSPIPDRLSPLVTYELRIEASAGAPDLFPVVTTIVAPGTRGDVTPEPAVTVTAVLPPVSGTISGTITAVNGPGGERIDLPGGLKITSRYLDIANNPLVVDDSTGSGTRQNQEQPAEQLITPDPTDPSQATFDVPAVQSGNYEITITPTTPPGFKTLAPNVIQTVEGAVNPPDFEFEALPVTLTAVLNPTDDYPNLRWELAKTNDPLLSPIRAALGSQVAFDETTGTLTITDVPPSRDSYTLTISDDLHANSKWVGIVNVNGDGNAAESLVPLAQGAPSAATVKGTVGQVTSVGTSPLAGGVLRLAHQNVNVFQYTCPASPPLPPAGVFVKCAYSGNTYEFIVDQADVSSAPDSSFILWVSNDGFATQGWPVTLDFGKETELNVEIKQLASINVTVVDDDGTPVTPPGLDVFLVDQAPQRFDPILASAYDFQVAGGPRYQVRVAAADYPATYPLSPSQSYIFSDVGGSYTKQVVLPRLLYVNPISPATPNVTVDIGGSLTSKSAPPYRFEYPQGSPGATGDATVTVTETGFRTQVYQVPYQHIETLDVELLPLVTANGSFPPTASGRRAPDPRDFSATSPGLDTLPAVAPYVADQFQIAGLNSGPGNTTRIWTLVFDEVGVGKLSGTETVSVSTTNDPDFGSVTVTPEDVPVTFTVTDGTGGLDGATVTVKDNTGNDIVSGVTKTISGDKGKIELDVPENIISPTFTVTKNGYIDAEIGAITGGVLPFPNERNAINAPAVRLYELAGTVDVAGEPDGGVAVKLCAAAGCPATTATTTSGQGPLAANEFLFASPPGPGTYYLEATKSVTPSGGGGPVPYKGTATLTIPPTGPPSIVADPTIGNWIAISGP